MLRGFALFDIASGVPLIHTALGSPATAAGDAQSHAAAVTDFSSVERVSQAVGLMFGLQLTAREAIAARVGEAANDTKALRGAVGPDAARQAENAAALRSYCTPEETVACFRPSPTAAVAALVSVTPGPPARASAGAVAVAEHFARMIVATHAECVSGDASAKSVKKSAFMVRWVRDVMACVGRIAAATWLASLAPRATPDGDSCLGGRSFFTAVVECAASPEGRQALLAVVVASNGRHTQCVAGVLPCVGGAVSSDVRLENDKPADGALTIELLQRVCGDGASADAAEAPRLLAALQAQAAAHGAMCGAAALAVGGQPSIMSRANGLFVCWVPGAGRVSCAVLAGVAATAAGATSPRRVVSDSWRKEGGSGDAAILVASVAAVAGAWKSVASKLGGVCVAS